MIQLYIVDYFDLFKYSGLTTYVTQLTRLLANRSEVNCNYILVNSLNKYKKATVVKQAGRDSIYIPHEIGYNANKPGIEAAAADFICKNISHRENVIFHFNWINHCTFAWFLKQKIACKTILTKHCIPWRDFIVINYPLFKRLNKEFLNRNSRPAFIHPTLIRESLGYDQMDHIICVTHYAEKALGKMFGISSKKVTVIYNGLQQIVTTEKKKSVLKKQYGFGQNEKIILFAGSIIQRKGIFDLVSTFNKIADSRLPVRLIIAGAGDHSRLFAKINKCWSKITITGNLDKQTLYDFYQMADIGIAPSYWDQCSYTAIEMMLHGLPIIVSKIEGLDEIVPDNCGLKAKLILGKKRPYIDSEALQKHILNFLNRRDIAKQYALRAQKYAKRTFNGSLMAEKTLAVYRQLIAETPIANQPALRGTKKNSPLVTVLLLCHNAEKYIWHCIDSILDQSYNNFELLIINDGSTDKTAQILQRYHDQRITFIKNDINRGIVYSVNRLLPLAKGKYITRFDADDVMHKDSLLKRVNFLNNHQDHVMVGCNHYVIDSTNQPKSLMQYPYDDIKLRALMFFRNPFLQSSVMMRSNVLKKIKYSERYKHCEDYYLWFNLATHGKISNMPDFLTSYRVHNESDSIQNNRQQRQNALELISDEFDNIGLEYSSEELATHAAIHSNYGKRFFNTPEKEIFVQKWVHKVLNHLNIRHNHSDKFIKDIADLILARYCDIN